MKRFPTSKSLFSGQNDRETLKEALQLLNMGKKTLGLNTEDPDLLLQLVDNPNEKNKSESIEKLLVDPKQIPHAPIGKQYLSLSGENGKVRVDNFTNVTPSPGEKSLVTSNGSDIQDVFKMVMEKKAPDSQSKVFHKITIIETNQLKPYSNTQLSHPTKLFKRRRRHKDWHLGRKFHIHPHIRQKRSRFVQKPNFFHKNHPKYLEERPFLRNQISKNNNGTNWRENADSSIEISLSKLSSPIHVNKRFYAGKTFREPENTFADKAFFRSGNGQIERKENIKDRSEKSNIAVENLRFSDEGLEKLIDSIGFENSLKKVFSKTTQKAVLTEEKLVDTLLNKKTPIANTIKAPTVDVDHQKQDVFPPQGMDRYALVERILPVEQGSESILSRFLEVAAIMILTLLCFITVLIVHSKLNTLYPTTPEKSTERKKEQVSSKNHIMRELNKRCLYYGMNHYKTVAMGDDDPRLLNLEWQSESGDWLSEIEEKEKL